MYQYNSPADDGSRELNPTNINKAAYWLSGLDLLWQPEAEWDIDTDFEVLTLMILMFVIT